MEVQQYRQSLARGGGGGGSGAGMKRLTCLIMRNRQNATIRTSMIVFIRYRLADDVNIFLALR